MQKYVIVEKEVGETPLATLERYRSHHLEYRGVPMAYAGRLDPMASGALLILIGEECKRQEQYHTLDKEYEFSVLFGVSSDTGDVLGRLVWGNRAPEVALRDFLRVARDFIGPITLPYPHFSSKTLRGKPLHTWTLENRLGEIDIPTYTATIYTLKLTARTYCTGESIANSALKKVERIPPVTEASKELGRDFRRKDVRRDWEHFRQRHGTDRFAIGAFTCVCSSGLYMRSLAEVIAKEVGTKGLALSIHRTRIGRYHTFLGLPFWRKP